MQYFITYNLGHQSTSGKKAQLGTVVHKVMEVLGGCQHLQQDGKKMLLVDDALGEIKFNRKKLKSDEFVNDILKQSYDWYTSNCTHKYTNADYKFCDKLTWEALNYNDGEFDPRKRKIVAAEPQFDIEKKPSSRLAGNDLRIILKTGSSVLRERPKFRCKISLMYEKY